MHFLLLVVINSNLGRIFHRFQDMASFPWNFLLLYSTPNLKMFSLNQMAKILHARVQHANYSCKRFPPTT